MGTRIVALRSLLFVPGDDPRKIARATDRGADAVVFDLEDAVAFDRKDAALARVVGALDAGFQFVRINSVGSGRFEAELAALTSKRLRGVVVPKVEAPDDLALVGRRLGELEAEWGVPAGSVRLLPIIESALGLTRADEIAAASQRVVALIFGTVDFVADLGIDTQDSDHELLYARSRIVVAARAAGLEHAVDGPYTDLDDLAGLSTANERSRRLGFSGRVVVHPTQIASVNTIYSGGDRKVLRRLVQTFEKAERDGRAAIRFDGMFVDYATYRGAKARLAEMERGIEA